MLYICTKCLARRPASSTHSTRPPRAIAARLSVAFGVLLLVPRKRIEFTFFPACAIFPVASITVFGRPFDSSRSSQFLIFSLKHFFCPLSPPTKTFFFSPVFVSSCIHVYIRVAWTHDRTAHTHTHTHTQVIQIKTFFSSAECAASAVVWSPVRRNGMERVSEKKVPKKCSVCM